MKNENQKIMIAASHRFHNHRTFPFPRNSPISALIVELICLGFGDLVFLYLCPFLLFPCYCGGVAKGIVLWTTHDRKFHACFEALSIVMKG